ncbi:hypothetical protein AKO1_011130 [Acrasis kona]|uniref:Uncharacterized protein n=1 Tax=Acrasis kona TaxID=1008807 RepID=A0AAW2YYK7_9EUKA
MNRVTLVLFFVFLILATAGARENQFVNTTVIHNHGNQNPKEPEGPTSAKNEEKISMDDLKKSNNDRSRSKNPQDKKFNPNTNDSKSGSSARKSHNDASRRTEQINPTPNKYSSWTAEELQNHLNHRSDSMNPNSPRYNPTSASKNLKSSNQARLIQKELDSRKTQPQEQQNQQQQQEQQKQEAPTTKNLSQTQYAVIKSFVSALLSKCYDKEKWDSECAYEVAKEVGVSSLLVTVLNNIPLTQAIQRLYMVNNACISTSGEQCLVACTKFVTSISITMTSYSVGLWVLGPMIDGVAQHFVTDKLLDFAFDTSVGEDIKSKANSIYDVVSENHYVQSIGDAKDKMFEKMDDAKDKLFEKMEDAKDKLFEEMDDAKDKMFEKMEDAKDKLFEEMEDAKDKMFEKMDDAKDKMFEKMKPVKESLLEHGNVVKEKLGAVADEAKEKMKEKAESMKEWFGQFI